MGSLDKTFTLKTAKNTKFILDVFQGKGAEHPNNNRYKQYEMLFFIRPFVGIHKHSKNVFILPNLPEDLAASSFER